MGQVSRAFADEEMLEWVRLLERLRLAATDKKKRSVLALVRELVEEQELLAEVDDLLVLRRRPTKRYRA
jgi:hypothetical protein